MIRSATLDDAGDIARVMAASWEGAYRGLMPDAVIDRLTVEVRTRSWIRSLTDPEPGTACFVARHGDELVGVAEVGRTRDDDLEPGRSGEIRLIYVLPEHWGHKHGRELMAGSLSWLTDAGYSEAMLWVLDSNQIGRRFYEGGGWRHDEAVKVDESFGAPLRELRYRIDLPHDR